MSYQEYRKHLPVALLVILIFAYIEYSSGNFEAFDHHIRGLTTFLDTLQQESGDPSIKSLLAAWMQARLVVWWSRAYYRSVEAQINLPSVPLPAILYSNFGQFEERRVLVLSIMCESHRLNTQAVLKYCSSGLMRTDADARQLDHEFEEIQTMLRTEAGKLDEWLLGLPPTEKPRMRDITEHSASMDTSIYFQSHDAALNYAYYLVARITQSTECLSLLPTRTPHLLGHEFSETKPWILLLLRIAQGIDIKTAVTRNTYTIGFSGLLLAAFLRCQDLALSRLIENWLQALENLTPTEEGSFPVFQILSVIKAINSYRFMGRDVFAVSQPIDDLGGPKLGCYCSQKIDSLFVHGKLRSTGDFFTELISIDGQGQAR
ncbi:hypothetical protein LTR84_001645 [Exophiala bonariae]|uniref:Transcription factor domain-containing protein n=1 Tax=Exophiala bonariae TaxID=1690606 RepID=A0AAV9NB82_9EURO|nr:hypothetical protein LTR84_001645 [Exophiala bonariae]